MSVKSDRPIRPGGCSWRKMTSRLGPLRALHRAMRRSMVRRTPAAISGCRRQISSKIATVRMPGAALQHRHDLAVPDPGERVGTAASTRRLLLRRRPRIGSDPIGAGGGKPSFRSSDRRGVALTGLHIQPRLAVGDVSARQAVDPSLEEESDAQPNRSDRQTASAPWGQPTAGDRLTSGNGGPPSDDPRLHSHPD